MAVKLLLNSDGKVVNRIVLSDPRVWSPPVGHTVVDDMDGAEIGDTILKGSVVPRDPLPATEVAIPQTISDRQFFQMLAMQGLITKDEAMAAVKTGDVPRLMQGMIEAMPDEDSKFAAGMLLSGATEFRRDHALVAVFATSQGYDDDKTDEFFRAASAL